MYIIPVSLHWRNIVKYTEPQKTLETIANTNLQNKGISTGTLEFGKQA